MWSLLRSEFVVRFIFLTVLTACHAAADELPQGIQNTQNPNDVSLTPAESLAAITVPRGFHVSLFAGEPDVRRPIAFDFDDRGRLWVVENYSHPTWSREGETDRVLILEDTDHDGRFDQRTVFWDKGRYLSGIAWGHGGIWLGNSPELIFIADHDQDDVPDAEPQVVLDGFLVSKNNILNNFHWGPDGWLYGAIGLSQPSYVGPPGTAHDRRVTITRGIWRYHPQRLTFEVIADGMVNPWGADFNEWGDLFTTNTVTGHLWHIIPGMFCQRRDGEGNHPHVYQRIQSIANHLHWGGGRWQDSRGQNDQHSVAGGGHAHCGGMVYLGDNWPKEYRGKFYMANLHGNRLNCDRLVPNRSTYVGVHDQDMFFANDRWFRGLSVKYGPDGGVFVSDWHDLGECHDNDGSHRSSGRIYKVVYGAPLARTPDLQALDSLELVHLHRHANAWYVRHARRLLHERSSRGKTDIDVVQSLRRCFREGGEQLQVEVLWTLFTLGDLTWNDYRQCLRDPSPHVRRCAVRCLADGEVTDPVVAAEFIDLAKREEHAAVRLALASALQRMESPDRWKLASELIQRGEDVTDPYIPLMIWYGMEPLITTDVAKSLDLAVQTKIRLLARFIARRLTHASPPPLNQIIVTALRSDDELFRSSIVQGILEGLDGIQAPSMPTAWSELDQQIAKSGHDDLRALAIRLATRFGDVAAIEKLRRIVNDQALSLGHRQDAFRALLDVEDGLAVADLHQILSTSSELRSEVLEALLVSNNADTPHVLLKVYHSLGADDRRTAISVLATRRDFAGQLLTAIEDSVVAKQEVSAFTLQQLQAYHDPEMIERIQVIWEDDTDRLQKSDEIARYKGKLHESYLAEGDVGQGRLIFEQHCAKCHSLFGEGGHVGPDLTGSGRKELDYILQNLVDPSAVIDPAYKLTNVFLDDGRLFQGVVVRHGDKFLVLRTQEADVELSMEDIETLYTTERSMMPEGLLHDFKDEQVRDLILYLRSTTQVPRP